MLLKLVLDLSTKGVLNPTDLEITGWKLPRELQWCGRMPTNYSQLYKEEFTFLKWNTFQYVTCFPQGVQDSALFFDLNIMFVDQDY